MKKIILSLSIIAGLCSCDQFLEEEPKSFLSPDAIESVADAENVMAGTMAYYLSNSYYGRSFYIIAEGSSDQTRIVSTSTSRQEIDKYTFSTENSEIKNIWKYGFRIIANANNMLAGVSQAGNMTESEIQDHSSAARFIRAHVYFDLVRSFGNIPLITEPVTSAEQIKEITQTSSLEVLNFIESELKAIENAFSEDWNSSQLGQGKPTGWSAKALLSNVYLTLAGAEYNQNEKWALAAAKAKEVIDNGPFDLREDYDELWRVENKTDNEFIWSLQSHRSIHATNSRPGGIGKQSGWGLLGAEDGMMDLFDDTDRRKYASFYTEIEVINPDGSSDGIVDMTTWTGQRPYIAKWGAPRNTGVPAEQWNEESKRKATNMPIYRLSEMYLIHAEASNEANPGTTEALASLNEIRKRAGMTEYSAMNQTDFRAKVRQERTFELAFEMKRRFDLVRWGIFETVMGQDLAAKDNFKAHHKYYPVPQVEYDMLLNLDQADGYSAERDEEEE